MAKVTVTTDELYRIYRRSKSLKYPYDLMTSRIEQGDLYFALQRESNQGIRGFLRKSWKFMEFYLPFLPRLFFSLLRGLNINLHYWVDGNTYAKEAIKKANYAVIDDSRMKNGSKLLLVENTEDTLIGLAALHRKKLNNRLVGITGSCGKTTTKELINSVLSTKYSVVSTTGTQNRIIQCSQSILKMDKSTDIGVIEMAGGTGMASLKQKCLVVKPNCGIITSIGKAHLQYYNSVDGVAEEKEKLFEYLVSTNGHIFKNLNDSRVANMATDYSNITTYGSIEEADIYGKVISTFPFLVIRWYPSKRSRREYYDIITKLYGDYNLDNILSAISVGLHFDVPPRSINEAIQEYETKHLRSQVKKQGTNTIIFDSYNANPTSMRAALRNFEKMDAVKKVVIIGDMLELGNSSIEEHRKLILFLKNLNFDATFFIGKEFMKVRENGFGWYFSNVRTARHFFYKQNFQNTHILLKASRGIAVERIINH